MKDPGNPEEIAVALLQELVAVSKSLSELRDVLSALRDEEYLRSLSTVDSLTHFLQACDAFRKSAHDLDKRQLRSMLREKADDQRLNFQRDLTVALQQRGLNVEGHWPDFIVNDIFRLHVNLDNGLVLLNGSRLRGLAPDSIAESVKVNVLNAIDTTGDNDFADIFAFEYMRVNEKERLDADYTDIRRLYAAVRERRGRGYDTVTFGIELYRALYDTEVKGLSLDLSLAQNASGGIFVPAPGGGAYIAAVRLRNRTS